MDQTLACVYKIVYRYLKIRQTQANTPYGRAFFYCKQTLSGYRQCSKRLIQFFLSLLIGLSILSCGGCGRTGPLYLPNKASTATAQTTQITPHLKDNHA